MTTVGLALEDSWTEASRHLRIVPRNIELLLFSTIQPIMFVVLFVYVFGGSIQVDGLRELLPVPVAGDLQPVARVQLGVHRRRPRRGPPKGPHRPAPVAADGAVGGAHRAHGVRPRPQRVHVLRDARRRVRSSGSASRAASPRRPGRRSCCCSSATPELGAGADRALGEVGGGRQLGRVHLDVPDDVRVVGVRRPEHDARLARADRRSEPVHEGDERGAGALQRPRPWQRRVVDAWGGRSA